MKARWSLKTVLILNVLAKLSVYAMVTSLLIDLSKPAHVVFAIFGLVYTVTSAAHDFIVKINYKELVEELELPTPPALPSSKSS